MDRYADWLVLQLVDQGMDKQAGEVTGALVRLLAPHGIVARNDVPVRAKEKLPLEAKVLLGEPPEPVEIQMNGLRFYTDLLHGQKTGVFLDQRENYLAARRYARGRALDCFTGSGGFALHLASTCEFVEAIDSSRAALDSAEANAAANQIANVTFREADVLNYLPGLVMRAAYSIWWWSIRLPLRNPAPPRKARCAATKRSIYVPCASSSAAAFC